MPGLIYGARNGGLPIIDCEIGLPTPHGQSGDPKRRGVPVRALIDTGASHVVATSRVIAAAGLIEGGMIDNTTIGSDARSRPWYHADVIFRGERALAPHIAYTYAITQAQVIDDHLTGFDVILGWDALHAIGLQLEVARFVCTGSRLG